MNSHTIYPDSHPKEIDSILASAKMAFLSYRQSSLEQRQRMMYAIADTLAEHEEDLIETATLETHLDQKRLRAELMRTLWQWRSYADHCLSGLWMDIRIDYIREKEIRKTMMPLGPVAVFGASNFPFAYSTAGGDTASALAAGCPVIVKSNPGHPITSEKTAVLIREAIKVSGMPSGIFSHIHGKSFSVGEYLVKHPDIKAVAFTGSLNGGRQLFDWGCQRPEPIPVFAEMGSLNPVFVFPEKVIDAAEEFAEQLAQSITNSSGQFCTKPGLIFGIEGTGFNSFLDKLSEIIRATQPGAMLNENIHKRYLDRRNELLSNVPLKETISSISEAQSIEGIPTLAITDARNFLSHPELTEEAFGPFCLAIICSDYNELLLCARELKGQLTASIIATDHELDTNSELVQEIYQKAGRIIFNGVPTGVEVCAAMQHGGPYPATTDGRFSSVGGDSIKRFARPICFQNAPVGQLPSELRIDCGLNIPRVINNRMTQGM